MNENNKVALSGEVLEKFTFFHRSHGEDFYATKIKVGRFSGVSDVIPVVVSERLYDINEDLTGVFVHVEGRYSSYNKHNEDGKTKLILNVFCQSFEPEGLERIDYENSVYLDGFICKKPSYRETPFGRKICDLTIAVNNSYGKANYFPVICWGRNAEWAADALEVGTKIKITGRIQSREYNKKLPDGTSETRTAYEVSAQTVEEAKEDVQML